MTRESTPHSIRPMTPADIPVVATIDRLSFPTPWPASSYLYELKQRTRSFYSVLVEPVPESAVPSERGWRDLLRKAKGTLKRDQVIGYVGLRIRDIEAHISTIAVHPDRRGKSLGELLLLTTIEQALRLQATLVTLEVRTSNRVAQRMYNKYGFQFTGTHRGYYRDGEDAWLMAVGVGKNGYQAQLSVLRQILAERLCLQQEEMDKMLGIHYNQTP